MINRRHGRIRILVLGVLVLGFAWSGTAQDNDPDFWGTGTNIHYVSAEEFNCSDPTGNCSYRECGNHFWCDSSGYRDVFAPVRLPAGAQVQGYRVIYEDSSAGTLAVRFRRGWYSENGSGGSLEIQSWTSSGSPGIASAWVNIDPDITIDYKYYTFWTGYNSYYFWVTLYPSTTVKFRGVLVYWNRQISPAPGTSTFADVPVGSFGFKHIEALAASGITSGCGGGNFCPNNTLTRVEMAVFLAKALGLHWAP